MKQIRVLYTGRTGSGAPPTTEQIDVVTPRGAVLHFTQGSAATVEQQDWSYLQRHDAYQFVALDEPSTAATSAASSSAPPRAPHAGLPPAPRGAAARPPTDEVT